MNETYTLAEQQGEKLDIITDDLFITYNNITFANQDLEEASKSQRKSRKKYIVFSLVLIIAIMVALFFMFALWVNDILCILIYKNQLISWNNNSKQ